MADPKRIEDLTDEELAGMTPEQFASLASGQEVPPPDDQNGSDDPDAQAAAEEAARLAQEEADAAAASAATDKGGEHEDGAVKEDDKANGTSTGGSDDPTSGKGKEAEGAEKTAPADKADAKDGTKVAEPATADFQAQINALFAPFKANGREMKVESVDEARQLMSMGANYNKKMAGMKPHLATLRTLENAKIGEAELNFLIDLHRRDPVAINKLIQDSGIDPMDLSAEKAAGYTPGNHRPQAAEVDLDMVLEELKDSPSFTRTIDLVQNSMDAESQSIISKNPILLKVITANIESGVHDLVQAEIDRKRMFGQLTGLSDLEAYRQVGDSMHAAGKFAHLEAGQPRQGQQATPAPVIVAPNPKKAEDESKRNDAKRAVAPVRSTASSGAPKPDFNPLSMSDEEFSKLGKF